MPIPVVCPGCKASFNVSDKFAGKQGPCPKCKTPITIPKVSVAKPVEEVKIHAPEEATGGPKGASGRPVLKPISRINARLSPLVAGGIGVTIIAMFLFAWLGSGFVKRPFPLTVEESRDVAAVASFNRSIYIAYAIRAVALFVIGLPTVWAGYLILRDDELDIYRGRALWTRVGICLSVYLLLWAAYGAMPYDYISSWYVIAIIGIPIFLVGFLTAYYCFEFDPTSASVHFLFFVVATLFLGMTAGLTMPWSDSLQTLPAPVGATYGQVPLYDGLGQPLNDAAKKEADANKKAAAAAAKATGTRPAATRPAGAP